MTYNAAYRLPTGSKAFDQFFNTVFSGLEPTNKTHPRVGLPISVSETEAQYTLSAEVPGVALDGIALTITQDTLKLEVEKPAPEQAEGVRPLLAEHRYGSFARTLNFRDPVNADASEAKLEHGVLTVTVPKVQAVQPRRIEIKHLG